MSPKINIPWGRYALITELTCRLNDKCSQFGKVAFQKMMYLLQEVYGVNCGYRFDFHIYGPFSTDLIYDINVVESLGGMKFVPVVSEAISCRIVPGENSELLKSKAKDFLLDEMIDSSLNRLIDTFGNYRARDLELRSTVVYVAKELKRSNDSISETDIARTVKEIKFKFADTEIQQAIKEMVK